MEKVKFKKILDNFEKVNSTNRINSNKQNNEELSKNISTALETPKEEITCPYCESTSCRKWGKRSNLQRYRCKECSKTFNSLTGTPLARLRKKELWMEYSECLKNSMSIRKSAEVCNISTTTSFRWKHIFLSKMEEEKNKEEHVDQQN